ncbi:MAG: stage II sporulation protein D [Eubacteriales bacterium]|jgi:stage II sporulation protein D
MKRILALLLGLWLCMAVVPALLAHPADPGQPSEQQSPNVQTLADQKVMVQVYRTGTQKVEEMDLHQYLIGVLAGEMPASFEMEALKAQAVAARSYTANRMQENTQNEKIYESHQGAPLCDDPSHCKAYLDRQQREAAFGDNAQQWQQRLTQAVEETDGQVAVYAGEAICAVFHSTSAGRTENAADVWGSDVPYLQSVESQGEESSPRYESRQEYSAEEFRNLLSQAREGMTFPQDPASYLGEVTRSEAGGVEQMTVCGETFTGLELREIFGLRSTHFTLTWQEDCFRFDVLGYGHGVGMSQYGANYMASQGKTYEEIIKWYYTGVELAPMQ